jgi:hypothetical protein
MINESSLWNTVSLTPGIELEYSSNEEEEEEEEEGEEVEGIDRETAVEKYKSLQVEGRAIVKKNIILLKKLAVHFKKCKVKKFFYEPFFNLYCYLRLNWEISSNLKLSHRWIRSNETENIIPKMVLYIYHIFRVFLQVVNKTAMYFWFIL